MIKITATSITTQFNNYNMETNKEIPTADELFVKYSQYLQFEEVDPEYFIGKEDFKQSLVEYTKPHLSKQAEVIAENKSSLIATKIWNDYIARPHNKGEDYNFSYENMLKDIKSILQASEEYINNLK